jgi:probable 2-oxoglutarate dehydrogenase E1 component DHKTD1
MHLPSKHERRFLEKLLEQSHSTPISKEHQLAYWELLARSEGFDKWAAKKFPSVKRYGLEGGEGMAVAIEVVLQEAEKRGVNDVVLYVQYFQFCRRSPPTKTYVQCSAMPHRGRLNVLTQLLDLDMRLLVRKMRGLPTLPPSLPASDFTDDVLSHLFLTSVRPTTGARVHLLPNPSHLETVTPVGLGFARGLQVPFGSLDAQQAGKNYELGDKVLSLQVHGDAAFGGQGVVAESLNLASLPHFTVGGTVRIVVSSTRVNLCVRC